MPPESIGARTSLCNLLGYAEEILKAGEKVVCDLAKDALATFYEHDVADLEGVTTPAGESDGGWLRVARLHEIAAPVPPDPYLPWIAAPRSGDGVFVPPRLVATHLVCVSIEDESELVEAGLALQQDAVKPKGDRAGFGDVVDVLLRLENLSEFSDAFNEWVAGTWADWEVVERPRRRSMAFYNRLFEIHQRATSMGDDTAVETVFGVGLARWAHPSGRINVPLIEASVELELETDDSSITVRPRVQPPWLALRPFEEIDVAGVGTLQKDASQQLERAYLDPDIGFSPHERAGFEPVLRMCHARLASDAIYEPDARAEGDRAPPTADGKLRITDSWVIYVRQRSSNFRCEDIRRLSLAIKAVDEAGLPAPALQMTTRPTDAPIEGDRFDLTDTRIEFPEASRGVGHPFVKSVTATARTEIDRNYFFPLPYNDDQIEIVRRLEQPHVSGVVVQGPPGTGKTHTIANIISHYMATGRRVLVSAHEPEALSAIQGKLPASIRDLAISVIHSDREGARKLEQAVEILASQVKLIDYRAYKDRAVYLAGQLAQTRANLTAAEEGVRDCARLNLTAIEFRGESLLPMELAKKVEAERPLHAWFPDMLTLDSRFDIQFSDADITQTRIIRRELGRDLSYSSAELPDPALLPDLARLLAAHKALAGEKRADGRATMDDLPIVSFGPGAGIEEAGILHKWLSEAAAWTDDVRESDTWLSELYGILMGIRPAHDAVRNGLRSLCVEWIALCSEGRAFTLRGVALPVLQSSDETFDTAIAALAEGRKPFGMFSFGKVAALLKMQLGSVAVDGAAPESVASWACVREYRSWQRRSCAFMGRWSSAAAAFGFPPVSGDWDSASASLLRLGGLVERMLGLAESAPSNLVLVAQLFPYDVDATQVVLHLEVAAVRNAIGVSLEKEGHVDAHLVRRRVAEIGASGRRPFHAAIADIGAMLGDPDVPARALADAWREIAMEASRLHGLRDRRIELEALVERVLASGAPLWSRILLNEHAEEGDPLTPENWKSAWDWARADGQVRTLSDRDTFAVLAGRRTELEGSCASLMAEIVQVRTFLGLKQGITERVASALQKFAMKVRQLGAGTGKAAERHRRGIREATLEAAGAVPCWILPEWRVAEQLPSNLGAFDLVIIDEASQSDITSLPAVLRGKKLLVVGDDKQVSPSAVGMEERTVVQLRETFLRSMDIANFLEPTTSLYDLASMTFPGSVVMLREHFRCVEPIISFSSRFYPKALIPLRVPTAEERLDPPLIDVYVPEGRKIGEVNRGEANFIVGEIGRLIALPEFGRRTLGVISMIGDKQAKAVSDGLVETIGTEAIMRHRIVCGNASSFQGQERDIVFVSLVACSKTARAQTARLMEQRFNVAMSRARDRMYLVRSVAASELSQKDLKLAVIEHFRNPMAGAIAARDAGVLEDTESGFEREVGGLLLGRGYRVRPQFNVGGYRIDFVVEGEGSRRLAIELDGDRYHGPERWFEDMHRQRALERLGWIFWRCWGSHWLARRQECFEDLLATLARLGIEPVGGEMPQQIWTEHRVVRDDVEPRDVALAVAAELMRPVLSTVSDGTQTSFSHQLRQPDKEIVVEIGDTVIVRFADDNHVRRFRLSTKFSDPDMGEVGAGRPIAALLLGNCVEEEVDLVVDGRERRVIIEKITKAA